MRQKTFNFEEPQELPAAEPQELSGWIAVHTPMGRGTPYHKQYGRDKRWMASFLDPSQLPEELGWELQTRPIRERLRERQRERRRRLRVQKGAN